MTGGYPLPLATMPGHRHQFQQPAAGHFGSASGALALRGIDIWTGTTGTTGTPLISLVFSVLSLSSVTGTTGTNSFRVSARACGRALLWCLVPVIAGICSAVITLARHRLPAARHWLTLAMRSLSTRSQHGKAWQVVIDQGQISRA